MKIDQVNPMLYIGLGGAGGKVVGRIKHKLSQKWNKETFERLSKFVVLDTDSDATGARMDGKSGSGPVDESILISDFNKEQYARLARGDDYRLEDPYFTQWVYSDYQFRAGDSAGAGQIRMESRLGLYHSLRNPDADVQGKLERLIAAMRNHVQTVGKKNECHVHIVFSVAGGTGSGTFLTVAYLVKDIAQKMDINVKLFGYAIQPHVFRSVVGENFPDVCANAYASMMELEHANKVEVQGARGHDAFEFHFDTPERIGKKPMVKTRPFVMTYVIDVPEKHSINQKVVLDAVADTIYVNVVTRLGSTQASDADNYDKHSRTLYPKLLHEKTGDGYSAFFGAFGMCVLQVPDDDILRYCSLRFASSAVRAFLLMDDPTILPKEDRDAFNQFNIPEEELKRLDAKTQFAKLNKSFASKIEFLGRAYQDQAGMFLGEIVKVADGLEKSFQEGLDSIVEPILSAVGLPHLDPDSIDDSWSPSSKLHSLERKTQAARDEIAAALEDTALEMTAWWPKFLGGLGNPYRQRYALAALRGFSKILGTDAPLSETAMEESERGALGAQANWSEKKQTEFEKTMEEEAANLREAGRVSWLKSALNKDKVEEMRLDARNRAADTFNERARKIRSGFRRLVEAKVKSLLVTEADKLLSLYQKIESNGRFKARELEAKAESYQKTGAFSEKLLDGSIRSYESEANQFAIDEEALMDPAGERLWDWYFDDQIAARLGGSDQVKAVEEALQESLMPERTEQGKLKPLTAERVVEKVIFGIRTKIEGYLQETITGAKGEGGLTIDDAIALEGLYIQLSTKAFAEDRKTALARYQDQGSRVDAKSLWRHPELGSSIIKHARAKLRNCYTVKSDLLAKIDEAQVEGHNVPKQTLIGAHQRYQGSSHLGDIFGAISGINSNNFQEDWTDQKRIIFYRYFTGIPIYAFTNINRELQTAYREHQAQGSARAWYLHTDKNFDNGLIPQLDPMDLRKQLDQTPQTIIPLLYARGLLSINKRSGAVEVKDPETKEKREVTQDPNSALPGLWRLKKAMPETYNRLIGESESEAKVIDETQSLAQEDFDLLKELEGKLSNALMGLEKKGTMQSIPYADEMKRLVVTTRELLTLRVRTGADDDDDSAF